MKTAEIKEMPTSDLVERVEAEVANYNQVILNHSISLLSDRFLSSVFTFSTQLPTKLSSLCLPS